MTENPELNWAIDLGPIPEGDIELMEDAIEALESGHYVAIEHALHGLRKRVEAARSLAASPPLTQELGAVPQWMPIETAPRGSGEDGPGQTTHPDYVAPPKILLATAEGIVVGCYDWFYHPGYGLGAEPSESVWRDHSGERTYGVTHWMPLPPPPVADPGQAQMGETK